MTIERLVEELSVILKEKALKLATAESCTGGMIAASITARPGSSDVFERGFVTYSNDSKIQLLDVSPNILRHYGAVSHECADAMVLGTLRKAPVDLALSVTGIAGPSSDDTNKPVGLVYIAVAIAGKEPRVEECHFDGDRTSVRTQTCEKALSLLIETVGGV